MMARTSLPKLDSEFDAFLFAPMGEEPNGMQLNVVSALARLNIDPWRAAADLARMPRQVATSRLEELFAELPDRPKTTVPIQGMAEGLISLLPKPAPAAISRHVPMFGIGVTSGSWLAFYVIFMITLLSAQYLVVSNMQAPAQPDDDETQISDSKAN